MNPSTGTFISMDSYNGSINDPVSLHKYLYANANPVMYSDPSGYVSLAETMVTYAVIGALTGGMINAGMNVLRFLTGDPSMTDKYDSPITAFIDGFLDGMIWGAFVGISIATFLTLGIYAAIAVAFNLGFSYYYYTLGKEAAAANDWESAIYYLYLSICSAGMAFATISMAADNERMLEENVENTSSSGTDNSTGNTQTPTNNSSRFNYTKTTEKRMDDPNRYVPEALLEDAIKNGTPGPDPQGSNATMYYTTMYKNGKEYTLEVLYDEDSNTIYHFVYK